MNLYPSFLQNQLDSGNTDNVDLNTDTIKFALVEGGSYDSADVYMSDLIADAGVTVVARSGALASPTVTNGTFDCADKTVSSVTTGHTISRIVVFKDTGSDATSPLIADIDKQTDGSTAISQATNGGDIVVSVHSSGVFDL